MVVSEISDPISTHACCGVRVTNSQFGRPGPQKRVKIAREIGNSHCKQKTQITRKRVTMENASRDPQKFANCGIYQERGKARRCFIRHIERSDIAV